MGGGEMIQPINDGGPAFPLQSIGPEFQPGYSGMTLRQYAAIKLCVPDSGLPWLDEMIVQSRRFNIDDATLAMAKMNVEMLKAREAK
jgi:hypothetical protein